jgi:hypothetical protein
MPILLGTNLSMKHADLVASIVTALASMAGGWLWCPFCKASSAMHVLS